MHKKSYIWKSFGSQRFDDCQKLLKSAEKYFYSTFLLFWAKLCKKKLFLVRSEISELLVNTLTSD